MGESPALPELGSAKDPPKNASRFKLYQRQGYPTEEFIQLEGDLQTDTGQQLWKLIREDPEIFTAWFSTVRS